MLKVTSPLKILFTIQEQGHRTVIFQTDDHMRPETACGHADSGSTDGIDKVLVQPFCQFWFRRLDIAGTAAMAGIAIEGKLGNDEHLPAYIQKRIIQFVCVIFENTQMDDFIG